MKNTTRRRIFGRTDIAQTLQLAVRDLTGAIEELKKPAEVPANGLINGAIKALQECVKYHDAFNVPGKRLKVKLEREIKHLQDLIKEIQNIPISQEEKLTARVERKKRRSK